MVEGLVEASCLPDNDWEARGKGEAGTSWPLPGHTSGPLLSTRLHLLIAWWVLNSVLDYPLMNMLPYDSVTFRKPPWTQEALEQCFRSKPYPSRGSLALRPAGLSQILAVPVHGWVVLGGSVLCWAGSSWLKNEDDSSDCSTRLLWRWSQPASAGFRQCLAHSTQRAHGMCVSTCAAQLSVHTQGGWGAHIRDAHAEPCRHYHGVSDTWFVFCFWIRMFTALCPSTFHGSGNLLISHWINKEKVL